MGYAKGTGQRNDLSSGRVSVNIIFLDIDGVVHPLSGDEYFNPGCMNRLRLIVSSRTSSIPSEFLQASWTLLHDGPLHAWVRREHEHHNF